ncbi:MAG: flavodoxin-dependent (E)-4-hydroxy-3-methylbut-2-enyl-diphosphate synthase [Ruminococcaceae bacterium]|nr:flavodoxin-dependent (E)-4-hydroxy-3-methylbut-2-enyl-diphosphate synthase [Oscillospiraceae bacterium]
MKIERLEKNTVKIGNVSIGGNNPILVQSMCNTKTSDYAQTTEQILQLENAGCEIVRVSVPDNESADAISKIKQKIHIPLVADIHFDYKLALKALENGIDKIRINPGNIGGDEKVKEVVKACTANNIPIRIGVNSGSLPKDIQSEYGVTPKALYEAAKRHIELLEKFDFNNIVVSVKSSSIPVMTGAYELLSDNYKYPLHLGLTEAGTLRMGTLKSSMAIGALLLKGIGDTIRVSLTDNPVYEVEAAFDILKALDIRKMGANLISCPTCSRTCIDIISIAKEVEKRLKNVQKPITVAVMGCVVNGPGEAKEADVGIAGGNGEAIIFKKGKILKKVNENEIIDELFKIIEEL